MSHTHSIQKNIFRWQDQIREHCGNNLLAQLINHARPEPVFGLVAHFNLFFYFCLLQSSSLSVNGRVISPVFPGSSGIKSDARAAVAAPFPVSVAAGAWRNAVSNSPAIALRRARFDSVVAACAFFSAPLPVFAC